MMTFTHRNSISLSVTAVVMIDADSASLHKARTLDGTGKTGN